MRSEPQGTSLSSGGVTYLGLSSCQRLVAIFDGKWRIIWAGFSFYGKHLCK